MMTPTLLNRLLEQVQLIVQVEMGGVTCVQIKSQSYTDPQMVAIKNSQRFSLMNGNFITVLPDTTIVSESPAQRLQT